MPDKDNPDDEQLFVEREQKILAGELGEWAETDRKRGILTQTDREFLLDSGSSDGEQYEGQQKRNVRYRIRQRVIESLLDIVLITEFMPEEDMQQVVSDDRVENVYVQDAVAQLAYDLAYYHPRVSNATDVFEQRVGNAVSERASIEDAIDKKEAGTQITQSFTNVDIEHRHEKLDVPNLEGLSDSSGINQIHVSGGNREETIEALKEKLGQGDNS